MSKKKSLATKPLKRKVVLLTDFQFHSRMKLTPSVGKKIQEGFEQKSPGRFYTPFPKLQSEQDKQTFRFEIDLGPDFIRMIEEERANGCEIVFALPKGGVPIFAGADTIEFLNSKNGQRFLRGLDKKKKDNKI